ncbi:MAG TPA: DUF86 domain-containing protein [Thermomicrobiales bacterium]|nr:DUF86 domain-containing protein [Thermomicrobiales bacterium]
MQPKLWTFRIRHILQSIEKIQRYTAGTSYEAFVVNDMAVDAVIRNFEIIGIATQQIPDEVTSRYQDIPWAKMRGMRNVLAHQYEDVRLDVVWDTIQREFPDLVPRLTAIYEQETS